MSHFRGFYTRDYQTFGMEVEVSTQAYRKLKKSITRKKILNRYGREITADVAPYIRVAAIMREAHWLVSENHSFSKFQIDDGPVIYIEYPEGTIEYRKPTQRKESTRMTDKQQIIMIPLDLLEPHPDNPRKDVGDVSELAESVKAHGILQNLTVVGSPDDKDKFRVIIGHRRLAAAKLAGLTQVPCVISDMDYAQQIRTMLTENMQRSDLTYYEQAQGFQMMLDLGDSVEQIAERAGFSTSTVRRRLKMAELDSKVLKKVSSDGRQLSLMDFDKLAEIEDINERNKVLEKIGTTDFNQELEKARVNQKVNANLPKVKAWLKKHGAKKISRQESWSNRFERFMTKDRVMRGDIWIDKFGEPGNIFPPDKDIEEGKELFYVLEGRYVGLHQKRANATREKKSEEQKNKERAQRENKKQARELAEMCFNLRKQFVEGLSLTKQNTDAVLMGATKLISYYCQSHSQWHSDGVSELLGLEKFEYGKKVREAVQKIEKGDSVKLLYACYDDGPQSFPGSIDVAGDFVRYDASFNTPLWLLYDWLVSMGYEKSTDEQAMMDGTHKIYHAKADYQP